MLKVKMGTFLTQNLLSKKYIQFDYWFGLTGGGGCSLTGHALVLRFYHTYGTNTMPEANSNVRKDLINFYYM